MNKIGVSNKASAYSGAGNFREYPARDSRNFPARKYYLHKVGVFSFSSIPFAKFSCREIA